MKKLLIITNLFHSSPRIPGLCKYLAEYGWEPTLLVTPLGESPEKKYGPTREFTKKFRTIEVEYFDIVGFLKELAGFKKNESSRTQLENKLGGKSLVKPLVKKLLVWAGAIIAYPDEMRGWRKPAIRRGKKILEEERFDAILTSSSPVTSHRIAQALKRHKKLAWHADLRDLWTQNHAYPFPFWRKFFETRLEKRVLRDADALSSVSYGTIKKLKGRYGQKPVFAIHNGFDPETVSQRTIPLTKKFTITYTGQIYQNKQSPEKFLAAVRELIDEKKLKRENVEIRFYGNSQAWIEETFVASGIGNLITQYGVISRNEAFERQRESQVLLVFGWEDDYELGVFPTKLFEYFAARRPILVTGGTPTEEFRGMLDKSRAGRHAIGIPEIKEIILDYYNDYLKNDSVTYHGIPEEMAEYDYRNMAKKFVEALEEAIKENGEKLR